MEIFGTTQWWLFCSLCDDCQCCTKFCICVCHIFFGISQWGAGLSYLYGTKAICQYCQHNEENETPESHECDFIERVVKGTFSYTVYTFISVILYKRTQLVTSKHS